jgi:hypothetical protein
MKVALPCQRSTFGVAICIALHLDYDDGASCLGRRKNDLYVMRGRDQRRRKYKQIERPNTSENSQLVNSKPPPELPIPPSRHLHHPLHRPWIPHQAIGHLPLQILPSLTNDCPT